MASFEWISNLFLIILSPCCTPSGKQQQQLTDGTHGGPNPCQCFQPQSADSLHQLRCQQAWKSSELRPWKQDTGDPAQRELCRYCRRGWVSAVESAWDVVLVWGDRNSVCNWVIQISRHWYPFFVILKALTSNFVFKRLRLYVVLKCYKGTETVLWYQLLVTSLQALLLMWYHWFRGNPLEMCYCKVEFSLWQCQWSGYLCGTLYLYL